jgi:hypothetical protein
MYYKLSNDGSFETIAPYFSLVLLFYDLWVFYLAFTVAVLHNILRRLPKLELIRLMPKNPGHVGVVSV